MTVLAASLVTVLAAGPVGASVPESPTTWSARSDDGLFELKHEIPAGLDRWARDPFPLVLRNAAGDVLWTRPWPSAPRPVALISDDGRWVALLEAGGHDGRPDIHLLGEEGQVSASLSVMASLTEEERRRIPQTSGGTDWLHSARFVASERGVALLEIEVRQYGAFGAGFGFPPPPEYRPTLAVRIEPATGRLHRDPPLDLDDRSLVARLDETSDATARLDLLDALLARTWYGASWDIRYLRRFWLDRLHASPGDPDVAPRAIAALGQLSEVATLERLAERPPEDLDAHARQRLEQLLRVMQPSR